MKKIIIHFLSLYRSSKHKFNMFRQNNWRRIEHLSAKTKISKEWNGTSYGGFYVHPDLLQPSNLVVSIGIGKDISFDLSLISKYQSQVFAFDPTPKSLEWLATQALPDAFKYFGYGIDASINGHVTFYLPRDKNAVSASTQLSDVMNEQDQISVEMRTFNELVKLLPHKRISVLKMDIEGAEYDVLPSLFDDPTVQIDQLLVEFHDRMFPHEQKPKSIEAVNFLKEKGYVIFGCSISSEEISFIHQSCLAAHV
jgi:FkbM family methyltransferase